MSCGCHTLQPRHHVRAPSVCPPQLRRQSDTQHTGGGVGLVPLRLQGHGCGQQDMVGQRRHVSVAAWGGRLRGHATGGVGQYILQRPEGMGQPWLRARGARGGGGGGGGGGSGSVGGCRECGSASHRHVRLLHPCAARGLAGALAQGRMVGKLHTGGSCGVGVGVQTCRGCTAGAWA